jgi:hypothetical protein
MRRPACKRAFLDKMREGAAVGSHVGIVLGAPARVECWMGIQSRSGALLQIVTKGVVADSLRPIARHVPFNVEQRVRAPPLAAAELQKVQKRIDPMGGDIRITRQIPERVEKRMWVSRAASDGMEERIPPAAIFLAIPGGVEEGIRLLIAFPAILHVVAERIDRAFPKIPARIPGGVHKQTRRQKLPPDPAPRFPRISRQSPNTRASPGDAPPHERRFPHSSGASPNRRARIRFH